MKKVVSIGLSILVASSIFTGCASKNENVSGRTVEYSDKVPQAIREKKDGIKLMVIRKIGGDDHTAQFLAGAKKEGESLGFQVDTFTANGDTAKFHDAINQAIDKKYDGVIISHGDDEATVEEVKQLTEKGVKVVTFDSHAAIADIDGVTVTSQDDESLAKLALEQLKEVTNGKGNIGYLWVDGFPPMVNRNRVYTQFLNENPELKEVERFGVAASDTSVQTQNAVNAILTKYKEGELTGFFATWDAFAVGATRAIKEAGRKDVKIVGIDVSNTDLQLMQEENSPWVATAACDPRLIGQLNVRLLAKKIAEEETPKEYKVKASLIKKADLDAAGKVVTMDNLSEIIPGWGQSDEFYEDWMKELAVANK